VTYVLAFVAGALAWHVALRTRELFGFSPNCLTCRSANEIERESGACYRCGRPFTIQKVPR